MSLAALLLLAPSAAARSGTPAVAQAGAVSISLALSPSFVPADGSSTVTATATVLGPSGPLPGEKVLITSSDLGDTISPSGFATDNGDGTYTATITSSTTPQTATITATDTSSGAPPGLSTTAHLAETGARLSVVPGTVSTNQPLTLISSVVSPQSGTITFLDGLAAISGCQGLSVSQSSPLAICQTSFAASSSPANVTAIFTTAGGSTPTEFSQTQPVTVVAGVTGVSLQAAPGSAHVGKRVTYTAVVTPGNAGSAIPTRSVAFVQGGKPIANCAAVPVQASGSDATASCSVTYSTPGTRHVIAVYGGDPNFSGSSSTAVLVPVQPIGVITSSMQWIFRFTPTFTMLSSLQVNGLSLGMKVLISCKGKGCPFATRTTTPSGTVRCTPTPKHRCARRSKGPVDISGPLRGHRLAVGAKLTIEIRRPGWVGKYYSFVIRAGHMPAVRISCIAPGLSKPGVAC